MSALCPPPSPLPGGSSRQAHDSPPPPRHTAALGPRTVLAGWELFERVWQDPRVNEVHIRGVRIIVCGTLGVYELPPFSSMTMARRAVETVESARDETGAVVTHIGDSIIVSRRQRLGPSPDWLVAADVVSEEQLAEVREALGAMRTVTVTGPAAPVLMRSFAALMPAGSRVFQGAYALLPPWCVAAASPLDADYVVGVRPGAQIERMAAMGQIGALIANPETRFTASVQLTVIGRSAAPAKVRSYHGTLEVA